MREEKNLQILTIEDLKKKTLKIKYLQKQWLVSSYIHMA